MATTETSALAALSNDIATTVERVASGVVAVEGRARIGSSGFYVRPDLILTADHALESDEIEIVRANGETETATIAGRDPSTDLALLRVENAGMPLEFASPDALRVGAIVLAVARDDDGDLAATMGVISAVGDAWRTWHGGDIDRFVRPDLSLYPRFSGSPLVDVSGRVIGLNTGGLSRRQTLTVPASTIERVVDALLTRGGRIPRGYLGVALQGVQGGVDRARRRAEEPRRPRRARSSATSSPRSAAKPSKTPTTYTRSSARARSASSSRSTCAAAVRRSSVQVTVGERPDHD